ncbi:hypothetical protein AB835_02675 [Candidatus Endobugula sertula]|uniref:DNA topoisomerase I n=1 Tax=Candidatus Endobugula sertula TaxID=62101 RepID=A0A1D2QSU7_9GAMM|nr:hypothetical protein AB835_02675 [Candidatus Endobugula sertula]
MTTFASLIILIAIAAISMGVVAYSNYKVEQNKKINVTLERMKVRVEELEDVVLVLDTLCEKRIIPRLVNDEIIENYEIMLQLNPKAGYLNAGLSNAQLRFNELSDESAHRHISRICKSDAQIARYQAYLAESLKILRKQQTENKISSYELQDFSLEIEWLQLQIKVITNIVQGHKAYIKQDILTANAFYKKAQTELIKSSHPDERRHQMISQVADVLFGRRKSLDIELMPESEFNPDLISEKNNSDSDKDKTAAS